MVAQDQGFSPRENLLCMIKVMLTCLGHVEETLVPGSRPDVGGSLSSRNTNNGQPPSQAGGTVMSGRSAQASLGSHHLTWHINCLEILAIISISETFPSRPVGTTMCLSAQTTHWWSPTSTDSGVCVRAPFIGWLTGSSCGLRESSSHSEQSTSLGSSIREWTIFSRQALRPGNGGSTPRWWSSSGKNSTRRK